MEKRTDVFFGWSLSETASGPANFERCQTLCQLHVSFLCGFHNRLGFRALIDLKSYKSAVVFTYEDAKDYNGKTIT